LPSQTFALWSRSSRYIRPLSLGAHKTLALG
jgi:hypothetical protein